MDDHCEIAGRAVEGDGFNNALVQKKQEAWFDRESPTFADSIQPLLAAFMDVRDVVIKVSLLSRIVLKVIHYLPWLAADRSLVVRGSESIVGVIDELFHLGDIDLDVNRNYGKCFSEG